MAAAETLKKCLTPLDTYVTIERMSTQTAHNTTTDVEEPLTTVQVAEQLGVNKATVRRWVKSGAIMPAFTTPGGHHRFDQDAVSAFKTAHRPAAPAG